MLCPLSSADLGFSGLKPHRRVISPLRSLLKTNAGDGKRSIGKDGSFSFRPWLRSTFFAKPHFTVVKLRSRRLFSDLAGGTGGTGGGGGGGRRDIYPPPGDDGRYGNGVWEAIVQGLLIAFVSLNIYLSIKYPLYKYKKLDDIDDWNDIQTLKRLLRETFEELVKVRERLSFVEQAAGIQEETEQIAGTSTLHSMRAQMPTYKKPNQRASSLSGSLVLGGGLLWEDENDVGTNMVRDASLSEISKLGVRLGTDLLLRFSGMVRGGRDSVLAEVQVDPGEDQFALQKMTYHCNALPWMKAIFSPFGASVQDVAFTLNPLAGQGLTFLIQQGSLLHQAIMGRAMGATVSLQRAWVSAAWFSPQSMAPLAPLAKEMDHAFLQAVVAPSTHLSVGLAVMEPIQTSCRTTSDDQPSDGLQSNQNAIPAVPTAEKSRRFAALVALRSSGLVMHGWATYEGDSSVYQSWNGTQWGFCLGPKPLQAAEEPGSSWAVAVGRLGKGVIQHWQEAIQPDTYEVSAQIHLGEGMSVIPGIVTLRRNDHTTVFAGLKTCWQF